MKKTGIKKDLGKPQLRLLFKQFPKALEAVVRCSEMGHEKYNIDGADEDYLNMYRVKNAEERYTDAAIRHLSEHIQGNLRDNESNLLHLAHCAWNILGLLNIELNREEMPICCSECGSTDVEVKYWVSPNTGEVGDTTSDGEMADNYCNNCEAHTELVTVKEYYRIND